MQTKNRILAVDDEVFNLDILQTILEEAQFEVVRASDGAAAMRVLQEQPEFDLVVLDRMMPQMNGTEVLKLMKANPRLAHIPVIMQTADGRNAQILEGIQAGAYYYLVKPYDEELLLSIVHAALKDTHLRKEVRSKLQSQQNVTGLLEEARFRFQTPQEAINLAYYIANFCPDAENCVYGLNELMINAIEHGNLRMNYDDKPRLLREGKWHQEVERHLTLPGNADKFVKLHLVSDGKELVISVTDSGEGFAWKDFMDFDPLRMTEPLGRGIAMCRAIAFPSLTFEDGGRRAVCRIKLI